MSRVPSLSSPFLLGFDEIERVLDRVAKGADGYPPYNIERLARDGQNPERLRITLAVAGFTRDQLDVSIEESQLVIRGRQQDDKTPAVSPPRHRRAPIPAHLRAGGRHGGAGRRPEERVAVDRSGAAASRADREDDLDQRVRMTEVGTTGLDRVERSMKGVEGHD